MFKAIHIYIFLDRHTHLMTLRMLLMCQTLHSPLRVRGEQDRQDLGVGFIGRAVGNDQISA